MTDSNMDRFTQLQIEGFKTSLLKVARDLRDNADEIERVAAKVERIGTGDKRVAEFADNYAWLAHDVQHIVLSRLLPNLFDALTTRAHELNQLRTNPPA